MTKELSHKKIREGWEQTFSTDNPFCPCDLKSFTKAVNWAQRALAAPSQSEGADQRPFGWARSHITPSSPSGPAERDVDMAYGDDEPEGDGWFPLYLHPSQSAGAAAPDEGAEEDWKIAVVRSATPYCLGCEKEGHRTDECWSTGGFNTPRQMEMSRLAWIANGQMSRLPFAPKGEEPS